MKRRNFIKNTLYSSAALASTSILTNSCSNNKLKKITILHTNDVHSHIDPFDKDNDKFAFKGGVSRRATIIEKIRKENSNTLLLDAGDIFQGTPYFNYYGGELEFKLMSMLKYDLATLGNHDFDNGIDGLYKQLPHANFNFVSANYDFKNTILDTIVKPYQIFYKDGIKIGIFGLGIELDGMVTKNLYKETKYLNPVEITQGIVKTLKQDENCDLIICLSHLGFKHDNLPNKISDIKLAKATKDIDLIIGGHTHTFMNKPVVVNNIENNKVIINQVGCHGLFLGKIDFYFDSFKNKIYDGVSIEV